MEPDDNVSGEFQRSTRMPLDAVVRLHFQGTVAYQNGFAANVSATGMFVKHPAPPPLGTQLVFEFNLGAERKPVQGAGEVVWVRDKYLGPGQPAGVGIRFLQLDSQSRDHIAEALFEFLEQSLTEDSLLDSSGYSFGEASAMAPARETRQSEDAGGPAPTAAASADAAGFGRADTFALQAAAAPPVRDAFADAGDIYGEPAEVRSEQVRPAAEPFAFPPLERLSPPSAADSAASAALAGSDGKRTFSVFSPLDEADPQTANIVREALREETPLPMMAAAAAASTERQGSRTWLVVLLLAMVAGGGWLAWKQWGASWLAQRAAHTSAEADAASTPAPIRRPEPLTAAPAPGTTLAETVGIDPNAVSPATAPPHSAVSPAPPADDSDAAAGTAAESSAPAVSGFAADAAAALAAAGSAPAAPTPEPADALPRPPAVPIEAVPTPAAARAQRLTSLEWRESTEVAGETVLVLVGDGAFTTGSFSYSEIGGESPRVLIKLKGMQDPYRGAVPHAPTVGGTLVRGVRTGFHVTPAGNEIHVVVDLARSGVKVRTLEPAASGLNLTLAP